MLASCLFLVLAGGLLFCGAGIPEFAEWYAGNVYPVWTGTLGRLSGIFPFSVVEMGLYAAIVTLLVTGVRTIRHIVHGKDGGRRVLAWSSGVFLFASVLFFLYVWNCGINYRRVSFSEKAGMDTGSYTVEELRETCEWLTEEVNQRTDQVMRDEDGEMYLASGERQAAVEAMQKLGETYPDFKGYYPKPKGILVSEILSYQSLTGIYSPFTIEANYNADMQAYNIPFTQCHELSHLRGFMQEEEANFIAFLACAGTDRVDFQYSGYLMAGIYSTNVLYRVDKEAWQQVRGMLDEKAELDLKANSQFWDAYEGTISEISDKVNDTYLKVNGQADGVQSYDRMVDLLVAYHKG